MFAPRSFDDDVVATIGKLHSLQLLERALPRPAVGDHLGDQAVARERPSHRLLRTERTDAPDRYTVKLLGMTDRREVAR